MAQIPRGRLVKGPYKPICRDCAIYFSITVTRLAGQIGFVSICLTIHAPSRFLTKSFQVGLAGRNWFHCAMSISNLHPAVLLRASTASGSRHIRYRIQVDAEVISKWKMDVK